MEENNANTSISDLYFNQAVKHGYLDSVKWCIENGRKATFEALEKAARTTTVETFKYLLEAGSVSKNKYNLLLEHASESGNIEIVEYLVSIKSEYQYNSLRSQQLAEKNSHLHVSAFLSSANHQKYDTHLDNAFNQLEIGVDEFA